MATTPPIDSSADIPAALQPLTQAFRTIGEELGNAVPNANGLSTALGALNNLLAQMTPNAAGLAAAFDQVGQSMAALAGSFGGAIADLGHTVIGFLSGLTTSMSSEFTGAASDAQAFTHAVRDMMGAVSQELAPALQAVNATMSVAANALACWGNQFAAVANQMASGLTPAFAILGDALGNVGQASASVVQAAAPTAAALEQIAVAASTSLQPALAGVADLISEALADAVRRLSEAVEPAIPSLAAFGASIDAFLEKVRSAIQGLSQWLGIESLQRLAPEANGSFGPAASGSNGGALRSMLDQAMSAYSQGPDIETPRTATAMERATGILEMIEDRLIDLSNRLATASPDLFARSGNGSLGGASRANAPWEDLDSRGQPEPRPQGGSDEDDRRLPPAQQPSAERPEWMHEQSAAEDDWRMALDAAAEHRDRMPARGPDGSGAVPPGR